ncbi:MAG: carboxymuconolactone decarboxylase family protein [Humibacter sp.]
MTTNSREPSPSARTAIEQSPREAARAFTPELTALIDDPLYSDVWNDSRLSPRDRSIATLASVITQYRPDELRAQLRRATANGLSREEISALITHIAFYAGFPGSISASVIANEVLGTQPEPATTK